MDFTKKILNSISAAYPIAFSPNEIRGHEKELEKWIQSGIIQKRTAITFPCGGCGAYSEIKTLDSGERVILCDSCEYARLYTLTEAEGYEYAVSLPKILTELLKELGLSSDRISASFKDRLWSLGVHDIKGIFREILFLRDAHDSEMEIFAFIEQKKASHLIILTAVSQQRLLNTKLTLIPLETLLASRGSGIFAKRRFYDLLGAKGQTASHNGIALGDSGLMLDKKALLHSPDGFGNYRGERLEPMEYHIIENLYRRGRTNKSKWYSRAEIADFFGVQEKSLSNAFTAIRSIAKKAGIEIVEQNKNTRQYRINPDLVP